MKKLLSTFFSISITAILLGSISVQPVFAGNAQDPGQIFLCNANLDGSQQVPPEVTNASGSATLSLDTITGLLNWNIVFSGLSGPDLANHMHGPAPVDFNAGVQIPLDIIYCFGISRISFNFWCRKVRQSRKYFRMG